VWQNIARAVQSLFYGERLMLQLMLDVLAHEWAAHSVYFQFLEHILSSKNIPLLSASSVSLWPTLTHSRPGSLH